MPTAAIEYEHVTFSYGGAAAENGERLALSDVTLNVAEGERLGVLGPNGGGKSTLLKLTIGLLRGYRGSIRVFGLAPEEAARRRLIGYVPQRSTAELAFPITGGQAVAMAAAVASAPWARLTREQREAVDQSM